MISRVPRSESFPWSCGWNILRKVVGIGLLLPRYRGLRVPQDDGVPAPSLGRVWGLCQDFLGCQRPALPRSPPFPPPCSGLKACQHQRPSPHLCTRYPTLRSFCVRCPPTPPCTAPVWGPRGCQGVGSPHGFSEVQTPSHSRGFGFVHGKGFLGNAYTETGQQEVTGLEY